MSGAHPPERLAIIEQLAREGKSAQAQGNDPLVRLIGALHRALHSLPPGATAPAELVERLGQARAMTLTKLGPSARLSPAVEQAFAALRGTTGAGRQAMRPGEVSGARRDPRLGGPGDASSARRDPRLGAPGDVSGARRDPRLGAPGDASGARRDPRLGGPADVSGARRDPRLGGPGDFSGARRDPRLGAPGEVSAARRDPRLGGPADASGARRDPRLGGPADVSGARRDPRLGGPADASGARRDPRLGGPADASGARRDPRLGGPADASGARRDPRLGGPADTSGARRDPRLDGPGEASGARRDPRLGDLRGDGFSSEKPVAAAPPSPASLSPAERAILSKLHPQERSFFLALEKRFQPIFTRMPPEQRAFFRSIPPNDRSAYLAMPPPEQSFFQTLIPAERAVYLVLHPEQREAVQEDGSEGRARLSSTSASAVDKNETPAALAARLTGELWAALGQPPLAPGERSQLRDRALQIVFNLLRDCRGNVALAKTRGFQTLLGNHELTERMLNALEAELAKLSTPAAGKNAAPGTGKPSAPAAGKAPIAGKPSAPAAGKPPAPDLIEHFKRIRTSLVEHAQKLVHPDLSRTELFEGLTEAVLESAELHSKFPTRRRGVARGKKTIAFQGRYIPG